MVCHFRIREALQKNQDEPDPGPHRGNNDNIADFKGTGYIY